MQILYQVDVTHDASKTAIDNFWASSILKDTDESVKAFSLRLVSGVIANIEEIDKKITEYAQNWKLERMAIVDRNIMRLGCFELVYCEDIPAKVSINEAVDLAKKFSGAESGKFVNAILDKVKPKEKK